MSVQFYLGYWTTLPFGVGIVFFLSLFRWIVRLAARHWAVFAGFVVMPFVVFTIYWGVTRVGMMREGLHPWFLMIFLFLVWAMPRVPEAQIAIARISARIQWLRTGELIGMLLVPTLLTRPAVIEPRYAFTDVVAIAVMSGASVLLGGAVVKAALPCLAAVEPETRKRKRTQSQASPL